MELTIQIQKPHAQPSHQWYSASYLHWRSTFYVLSSGLSPLHILSWSLATPLLGTTGHPGGTDHLTFVCERVHVCVCVCWWVGASIHMPEICKPNSWLLGDLRCKVNHTPGSWLKSLLAHARVPSWLSDDFFFFLIWTIFKVFIEFVTILFLFYF